MIEKMRRFEERKLQRMHKKRREEYLSQKQANYEQMVINEVEYQRMRSKSSYEMLIEIFLFLGQYSRASYFITQFLEISLNQSELIQSLLIIHHLLSLYHGPSTLQQETNRQEISLHGDLGSLSFLYFIF